MMGVPPRHSLSRRLLTGQLLVATVTVIAAALVASAVGPLIFHAHLMQAGLADSPGERDHIEQAYRDANIISLSVGLVVAVACAAVVTWVLTGRIQRPLDQMGAAAQRIAEGDTRARVPAGGNGVELDALAHNFNSMAAQIERTEDTRRRLLTDVGHELRTPVATLSAFLDGLHDGVTTWGPQTLTLFRAQVDRLAVLTRDLSEVSRAEEGALRLEHSAQPVGQVVHSAVAATAERYAAKGVHLWVEDGPGMEEVVRLDPRRLSQVLANLLDNALRHTPAGKSVRVEVAIDRTEVALTVTDEGEGIEPDQLSQVFERFYRGASARAQDPAGSGVGLTISKAIVAAHRGLLSVVSPGKGQGSRFTVRLPRQHD